MVVVRDLLTIKFSILCISTKDFIVVCYPCSVSVWIAGRILAMYCGPLATTRKVGATDVLSVDQVFFIPIEVCVMTGELLLCI